MSSAVRTELCPRLPEGMLASARDLEIRAVSPADKKLGTGHLRRKGCLRLIDYGRATVDRLR